MRDRYESRLLTDLISDGTDRQFVVIDTKNSEFAVGARRFSDEKLADDIAVSLNKAFAEGAKNAGGE